MSEDIYSIDDEVTQAEIQNYEEEQKSANKGFEFYLAPSKDQQSRSTCVRPVFDPKNTVGQKKPLYQVALHQGLDKVVPGSRRRPYPAMKPGTKAVVCLNNIDLNNCVTGTFDSDPEDFCHVCRDQEQYKQSKYDAQNAANDSGLATDKKLERSWNSFYSAIKRTAFYFMACIKILDEDEEKFKMGIKIDEGSITERNTKGYTRCPPSEAKIMTDPIGYIRIKSWHAAKYFIKEINRRVMSIREFSKKQGKRVTQVEYLRSCPKERPHGPFHPEQGFNIEFNVSGKGLDTKYEVNLEKPAPLTKEQKVACFAGYPNFMDIVTPYGSDRVMPLEEWLEQNQGKTTEEYNFYRKTILSEAQAELLGLDKEQDLPEESSEKEEKSFDTYDMDSSDDDLGEGFDIDDDIPF